MVATSHNPTLSSGSACLRVERVAGQSSVVSAYCTNPLKLLIPRPRGPSVWAYSSSFGGGLVSGDETRLEIDLGAGTRCFVGTQASTKIYRTLDHRACAHQTQARLDAGSLLVFAPDPVQAFAQSSYTQRQDFSLAADASLFFVDTLSSGRRARGESWMFDHFSSRVGIRVAGKLVLFDALRLDATDGPGTLAGRGARFHGLSTLVVVGPAMQSLAAQLLHQVGQSPVDRRARLVQSVSPLPGGAILRIAGEDLEQISEVLHHYLNFCEQWLCDNPWRRRN